MGEVVGEGEREGEMGVCVRERIGDRRECDTMREREFD